MTYQQNCFSAVKYLFGFRYFLRCLFLIFGVIGLLTSNITAQQSQKEIQAVIAENKIIAGLYPPLSVMDKIINYYSNEFTFENADKIPITPTEAVLYNSKIVSAVSVDGIRFERTESVISQRGTYPSLVKSNGLLICYYQTFMPESNSSPFVAAISENKGRSWQNKFLTIRNLPKDRMPSKPYAVKLSNGKVRLYFIMQANFRDGAGERLYYAESDDDFNFNLIGIAFGSNSRYPADYSVYSRLGRWEMFIKTYNQVNNFIADSADGRYFMPFATWNFTLNGLNGIVHSAVNTENLLRIYVFSKNQKQIRTYYTQDMTEWIPDNAQNIYNVINDKSEDGTVAFPAVIPLFYKDNIQIMFMAYVTGKRLL